MSWPVAQSRPTITDGGDINKNELAPWQTYDLSERLSPELEKEIDVYSKKRHTKTSQQNEEELARWKEENRQLARQYQFLTPEEYEVEGPRIKKILDLISFIQYLKKDLGLNCWYRRHPHKDKLTLVVFRNQELEVVCWVSASYMPEFSIMRFDDHGALLQEKYRGWRTALLQMILKEIITEKETHHVFGEATGPASKRYNKTLYSIRNEYVKEAK